MAQKLQNEETWQKFIHFLSNGEELKDFQPTKEDFLTYFDFLYLVKNLKTSTIWSIYNKLSSAHSQIFGFRLNAYPIISETLKSYQEIKFIFTSEEINKFLFFPENSKYWLSRKVFVSLAYFGGLRLNELLNLQIQNLQEFPPQGFQVQISPKRKFLVPEKFSWLLKNYLDYIEEDTNLNFGPLFLSVGKMSAKFSSIPLGISNMKTIGIEVATLLDLANPHLYTSFSFRRSAMTQVISQGATPAQFKQHFDIKNCNFKIPLLPVEEPLKPSESVKEKVEEDKKRNLVDDFGHRGRNYGKISIFMEFSGSRSGLKFSRILGGIC